MLIIVETSQLDYLPALFDYFLLFSLVYSTQSNDMNSDSPLLCKFSKAYVRITRAVFRKKIENIANFEKKSVEVLTNCYVNIISSLYFGTESY